jgi:subtilase family serine protease
VTNVVVRADLPAATTPSTIQAPGGWSCQLTSNPTNEVTCSNGGSTLAAGAIAQFGVHVVVAANSGATISGSTFVDPDNTVVETDESDNISTTQITVYANIDLSVTNSGADCAGKSGDLNGCTWQASVTNSGITAATGVVVRTDFPVGVIPLDVQAPTGWACQITENPINQVTCTTGSGSLAGGATANFGLHAYVTANTGDTISSTSIVDPDNTIVEKDESNNTASDSQTA